jgi:hypothetical protein
MRGHDRLSSRTFWGAEQRQGRGSPNRRFHSLDPDGWLVRFHTDTKINESPAARLRTQGETKNLTPHPTPGGLGPRLAKPRLLDTRLLMGGVLYKKASTGMAFGARLSGYAWIAARARKPCAPSDKDLATMADRGSTTRGVAIVPRGGPSGVEEPESSGFRLRGG